VPQPEQRLDLCFDAITSKKHPIKADHLAQVLAPTALAKA